MASKADALGFVAEPGLAVRSGSTGCGRTWRRLPRRIRGPAVPDDRHRARLPLPVLPRADCPNIPIFVRCPRLDTGVTMLIFVMMAIGLNIVVGYAGLLDLGYVAFYAIGAYTAAWFASPHFAQRARPLRRGRRRRRTRPAGSTSRSGSSSSSPRSSPRRRRPDRPADAAPARRLPRDRDARLRRDHAPDRPQRRQPLRHRLQPHERPHGINPIDPPGFGETLERHLGLPADFLDAVANGDRPLLLDGDRAAPVHGLLLGPPARLAARPRLDRDPRGRDRRGGDGRPADADEDLGLRGRRVLRRRRRRLLRELQERRRSPTTSSSTSRSSSSAWSSSAGWATSGG